MPNNLKVNNWPDEDIKREEDDKALVEQFMRDFIKDANLSKTLTEAERKEYWEAKRRFH